jgi:hypothetical protein
LKSWFSRRNQIASTDNIKKEKVLKLLEELAAFATKPSNSDELQMARDYYFGRTGQVFEDDPDFDQRMNTFLEWFVFDYKSGGAETSTMFGKFVDSKRGSFSNEEMIFLMTIGKHVHSIFQVKQCGNGEIKIKDLVSGMVYRLETDDNLEKGDLLERRLVCIENSCCFFHTYCLHPKLAYKPLSTELKKRKKSGLNRGFFITLQAMQIKWRLSRRIEVRDIYRF